MPFSTFKRRKSAHDVVVGFGVQRAGRLVGENQTRVIHDRPRDRDPLLLSAGELIGLAEKAVGKPDDAECCCRAAPTFSVGDTGVEQRQLDFSTADVRRASCTPGRRSRAFGCVTTPAQPGSRSRPRHRRARTVRT